MDKTLGKQIRIMRTARGLTQHELGTLVGCTNVTIHLIERSIKEPDADMEARIKAALGWDETTDEALALLETTS